MLAGYPNMFVYTHLLLKINFLNCFLSSVVFKYFNQRVIRTDEQNGLSFKGALKTKKKKNMKRLSIQD